MKRILRDGKYYRVRRGRLVQIPEEWLGDTAHPQTIRKRQSKHIKKIKRFMQGAKRGHVINYKELKHAPIGMEEQYAGL